MSVMFESGTEEKIAGLYQNTDQEHTNAHEMLEL